VTPRPLPPASHGAGFRRLAALLAAAALAGCAPTLPATRVAGRHVELYSDLPAAEAKALAADADRFLAEVCEKLGARRPSPRIYVFKNSWHLWLYLRRRCPAFSERAGACFEAQDGRLTVAVRAASGGAPAPSRLRHELVHAVIGANFPGAMPWLDEGLAQVFERGVPPAADPGRAARLAALGPTLERRLARLLRLGKHEELNRTDYLVAWGFTRFLLTAPAFGLRAVRACLELPAAGERPDERAVRCLGASTRELARRFAASVRPRRRR